MRMVNNHGENKAKRFSSHLLWVRVESAALLHSYMIGRREEIHVQG
jgi:hypothetical protein